MENIDLIRKVAWSFHNTTNVNWDDLFQEAALAYFEGIKTYDPKKGKITTYLWHCMSNRLHTYLREQECFKFKDWRSNIDSFVSFEEVIINKPIEQELWWEVLTEEAYDIAKIVIAAPKPYLKRNKAKVASRIKHIMKEKGWDWKKVRRGLEDLRIAYSQ